MKTKTKLKLILAAGAILPAAFAYSQVSKGTVEANFSATYSNNEVNIDADDVAGDVDFDNDSFSLSGTFGYFFTDNWQVTGTGRYFVSDVGDSDTDTLDLGVGVDYHFTPDQNLVPYLGVGLYYSQINLNVLDSDNDFDEDELVYELRGGMKQFIASNIAIRYQVSYNKGDDIENLTASVGLSTFF